MAITYVKQKTPVLYRYTNGEFYEFMSGVADDIPLDKEEEEDGPSVESLETRASLGASAISVSAELLDEFKAKLADLQISIRPIQGSIQTEQLTAADSERCKIANHLLTRIEAAASSPIQAEAEAGKLLENDFSSYDGIERLRLNDKSGVISGMVAKFALEKYSTAIQQLGLQPAITEMDNQNQLYRSLASQRRDEIRESKPQSTSKEIRADLGELFEEIYDRAFATSLLDRSEEAKTFMHRVNARIDEMISRLNNSDAQRENASDDGETNPPSTGDITTEDPDKGNPDSPSGDGSEDPDDRPVVH